MKKILIIISLLLLSNNLLAKRILTEYRMGINLGKSYITDSPYNDESLITGFNIKLDAYFKKQYSVGILINTNFHHNDYTTDLVYDFIPTLTKHLSKDFDLYVGAGLSLGKSQGLQDDGVSLLIGIDKKYSRNLSISSDFIYTEFNLNPTSKITMSLNVWF